MPPNSHQESSRPDGFAGACPAEEREVAAPSDVLAQGWWSVLRQTAFQVFDKRLLGEAAAVAFYALLTVFPMLAALIWLCGTFIDPVAATQALRDTASGILPAGAAEVTGELLGRLADLQRGGFGLGTGAALIGTALWGAIATAAQLFGALNVTYGEQEGRSLLRLHGAALLYAVGAATFIVLVLGAIIVPARLVDQAGAGGVEAMVLQLGRWPVLLAAVAFGLALTYRHGPDRKCPQWQWVSWGGAFAAVAWLLSSAAFSFYVSRSGGYDRLYGSLGAVVALMVWAWLSSAAVLIGAALNAELERHSVR
ncbi:YihY/virulence factor BrkB family protein [Muricoccus aerilatus]|uniref:YihY/virulence factor BrkB family protein n=1 Tax=Muricoccus aerilatus TaxID=452982 RepID=UPI00247FD27F|nr:YihY/virulence factor BrkB family protein [Roseomonas aerilata]